MGQKSYMNIDLNGSEMKGTGYVHLFNVNGQEVMNQTFYYTDGASAVQIELPDNLPTGIYVVKVASDGNINTGKIFLSGR
jgi:methionine-rich copper-binding protein CopC